MAWLRRMLARVFGREAVAPRAAVLVPAATSSAVLGVTEAPARRSPAVSGRVLRFRGHRWVERSTDGKTVEFVREVAVDGRAVVSELRVLAQDLVAVGDGWVIQGRE